MSNSNPFTFVIKANYDLSVAAFGSCSNIKRYKFTNNIWLEESPPLNVFEIQARPSYHISISQSYSRIERGVIDPL